jgi:P27 family predicted phage terminase small subunit
MGKAKKPTALKKLEGTYRPDREVDNVFEPEPQQKPPKCPTGYPAGFAAEWKRVCEGLIEYGMLASVDYDTIEAYCDAVVTFRKASRILAKEGLTTFMTNKTGITYEVASPYVTIKKDAATRMLQIAREFGFTPASRVKVPQGKKKDVNPFQAMMSANG